MRLSIYHGLCNHLLKFSTYHFFCIVRGSRALGRSMAGTATYASWLLRHCSSHVEAAGISRGSVPKTHLIQRKDGNTPVTGCCLTPINLTSHLQDVHTTHNSPKTEANTMHRETSLHLLKAKAPAIQLGQVCFAGVVILLVTVVLAYLLTTTTAIHPGFPIANLDGSKAPRLGLEKAREDWAEHGKVILEKGLSQVYCRVNIKYCTSLTGRIVPIMLPSRHREWSEDCHTEPFCK